MISISVNGQTETLQTGTSVAELLDHLQLQGRRVAVELNREIVPKSQHAEIQLNAGDQVEIVHAIGGG